MLLENMKREVILIEARAANTRLTAAVVYWRSVIATY